MKPEIDAVSFQRTFYRCDTGISMDAQEPDLNPANYWQECFISIPRFLNLLHDAE